MVEQNDLSQSPSLEDSVIFADNPEPRCACLLVLDVSGSMGLERGGEIPIRQLNDGLRFFKSCIEEDTLASLRTEIGVIAFNHEASVVHDFTTVDRFAPPMLDASGGTRISGAIEMALDLVEQRKQTYRDNGITYYRPWVWLICDGYPEHDTATDWENAKARVKEAENDRQLAFFTVGVEGADMTELDSIGSRQALKLQGLNFREMFQWLSSSMSSVSQSQPTESVPLSSPEGWAEV